MMHSTRPCNQTHYQFSIKTLLSNAHQGTMSPMIKAGVCHPKKKEINQFLLRDYICEWRALSVSLGEGVLNLTVSDSEYMKDAVKGIPV